MRLENEPDSQNVEDRREESDKGGGFRFPFPGGGDRMQIPIPGTNSGGGMSLITMLIILGIALFFGKDLGSILGGGNSLPQQRQIFPDSPKPTNPNRVDNDEMKKFVTKVLGSTENIWGQVMQQNGRRYEEPKLVLFRGSYPTACGRGQAAMGPFYCPADQKIYIDLSFYEELRTRFGAPGDFAQAYVIAHEVGHHVQTLLGIADKVQELKARSNQREANVWQVKMELQADCFAGVWAHLAHRQRQILEPDDVQEALRAASAIGDDRIQQQTTGRVVPDAFTHGSAEQRVRWFSRGLQTGDMRQCDTFSAPQL